MKAQPATFSSNKLLVPKDSRTWGKYLIMSLFSLLALSTSAFASSGGIDTVDMTGTFLGIFALVLFVGAYCLVIFEEQLHLRKSKPVLFA
ncbi:MAG: hypothetical protein KAU22_03140, partial [Desulfuromonadales bacterium]|nr:hypothetical protein [Desulfuromonadales bacterium]